MFGPDVTVFRNVRLIPASNLVQMVLDSGVSIRFARLTAIIHNFVVDSVSVWDLVVLEFSPVVARLLCVVVYLPVHVDDAGRIA
jgi:hypothetical protein